VTHGRGRLIKEIKLGANGMILTVDEKTTRDTSISVAKTL
jgi:hypothetical protein